MTDRAGKTCLLYTSGMRPMIGFNDAGITVYFENQTPNVGEVAKLVAAGSVPIMGAENACNHHH